MRKRFAMTDAVEAYVDTEIHRETAVQQRLRAETEALPEAGMQIGADQGAFFALLVRLIGAKRTLEIGTFTGYSALAVAAALPPDGKLIACDVSEEWTAMAKRYWKEAGVANRIDLRIAPAQETLAALLENGGANSFDFAFIDADKTGYDAYYEACLKLVRRNGLIAIDNVLWSGKVADPVNHEPDTEALRKLNLKIRDDARVEACMATIGDGVMLVRKK